MASLQTPLKALARRAFSSRWKLQRDSDMYANRAIREGLRSRAAYKLEEINNRFGFFLRPGACVVDLGASPGGFSLVAAKAIRVDKAMNKWQSLLRISPHDPPRQISRTLGGSQITRPYGQLICIDQQSMEPIPGAVFIQGDMRSQSTHNYLLHALSQREADVVLSDMAPDTTGEKETNHVRIMDLADEALRLARSILRNGGTFCCKIFSGADEKRFREELRQCFVKVRAFRPAATRKMSPEIYYIAQGFVPKHMEEDPTIAGHNFYNASAEIILK